MTLKNSFSKLLKEDRKRRIWTLVLFCLLCFLMTAVFELNLEQYINRELAFNKIQENIESLTGSAMIATYLVFAGIAACLYGFQGFFWLTKKEQIDFYHSQPVKREKRFAVVYVNGILMCIVPMLLHILVYGFLIGIRGYLSKIVLMNLLKNAGIFLIAFLMMYHMVLLAMMLCGNVVVSAMIAGILFVYATIMRYLFELYFGTYFMTYADQYANPVEWLGYLSPVERVYRAGNYMVTGRTELLAVNLLIMAALAIVFAASAFWLYKKRPSETAGQALAFSKAGTVIRFLMVIPAGMLFGIMCASFGVAFEIFWLFFGTIIGVILAHGFLEVIFNFDIKAAIGKKKQLLASLVLVLGIVSVFHFDLIGYDSYIPKESQVKFISYYIDIGEYGGNYQILNDAGIPIAAVKRTDEKAASSYGTYISRDEYQLENSATEDAGPILDLVEAHLNWKNDRNKDDGITYEMVVCYEMNSGRKVYRYYNVEKEILKQYYEPIYNTEQGKEIIYPYLKLSGKEAREVSVYAPFMSANGVELKTEDIEKLISCYHEDLREQTLTELLNVEYIGEINLIYDRLTEGSSVNTMELSIKVGSGYENVIKFLEDRGIGLSLPNENYEVIQGEIYNPYGTEDTKDHPFWMGRETVTVFGEELMELLPAFIAEEYAYYGYEKDYDMWGELTVRNVNTGATKTIYCHLVNDKIPEFMLLDGFEGKEEAEEVIGVETITDIEVTME